MKSSRKDTPEACDRRSFLTSGTAAITAALATGSAAAQESEKANDIEKIQRAEHNRSGSDAGPENIKLKEAQPNAFMPPATHHGETPEFWNTFSAAHRRIQESGWSRQVTVRDFPLSKGKSRRYSNAIGRSAHRGHYQSGPAACASCTGARMLTPLR